MKKRIISPLKFLFVFFFVQLKTKEIGAHFLAEILNQYQRRNYVGK
jgi:hypothetical protein